MIRILILFAAFTSTTLGQVTLNVPATYPTIQQAVDVALTGDTVLVAPGFYLESVRIVDAITVESTGGPTVTEIVWPGTGDQVEVGGGGTLRGFAIHSGPGVLASAPAVLDDCVIRNNFGTGLTVAGEPFFPVGTAVVSNCVIRDNVGNDGADATCASPAEEGRPGGVFAFGQTHSFVNCLIYRNTGGAGGAGDPTCSPPEPAANGGVGGVDVNLGGFFFCNCTIADNVAGTPGPVPGGVEAFVGMTMTGCIVWGNGVPSFAATSATVEYCDIEGFTGGATNIDADPLFVDPGHDDYHLDHGSPCIDAATGAFPGCLAPPTDLDGNPRSLGADVDIGADEHVAPLPGRPGDLVLSSMTDGDGAELQSQLGHAGEALVTRFVNDSGSLTGAAPVLLGELFVVGAPPAGLPGFGLWLDPPTLFVLHDGNAVPGPLIGVTPASFGPFTIPPGLTGIVLRLQGFAFAPGTTLGYALTGANDIHFR